MNRLALIISVVIGVSLSFFGCNNRTAFQEGDIMVQQIDINNADKVSLSKIVDSITYITLPDINGRFIRRISKLRYVQNRIYIYDHGQGYVAVYDSLGSPLFSIAHQGHGPGEYVKSACFTVDDNYVYILDNYTKHLLLYDASNGKYIKTLEMSIVADDMECLPDNLIGFCNVNMPGTVLDISQPDYRLFITDSCLNIKEKIYPSTGDDPIGQQSYFERVKNDIIFGSVLFDGFTLISDDPNNRVSLVKVNFTDGIKPHVDSPIDDLFNYQFITEVPKKCGDYFFIPINYGKGDMRNIIWKEGANQVIRVSELNYPFYPVGTINDSFIGLIDSPSAYRYLLDCGLEKIPSHIEEKLNNEEIVLILYHMNHRRHNTITDCRIS